MHRGSSPLGEWRRRAAVVLLALAAIGVQPTGVAAVPPQAAAIGVPGAASGTAASGAVAVRGGAAAVGQGSAASGVVSTAQSVAAASSVVFTFDVYRPGVYTMQSTWWYCTAASVQIMRNIARDETDHASASQRRYFDFMRARNRHQMPTTDGIDPKGFVAGLRAFVDPRYRLVASGTFDNAVRSSVMRLRASGLPVALIVDRGRHAWVLTGFTASADPASTAGFRVLSVRIVGPLYGRQSRNGYDPAPDTRLSVDAFRRYLTPYDFKYGPTPWDDRFVTFQVVQG